MTVVVADRPAAPRRWTILRWLLPATILLALAGYFGPWVGHRVAGLVVMGLDLGEYVKFLTPVRAGQIGLWREGFYLPLVVASLSASLIAFRRELRYPWVVRGLLLATAIVAALNLLPPAWTPQRMLTDEFRQQAAALAICLAAMAFSPLLALLPRRLVAVLVAAGALGAAIVPARQFLAVLPTIADLYHQPLTPGWGLWLCAGGLLALAGAALWFGWERE